MKLKTEEHFQEIKPLDELNKHLKEQENAPKQNYWVCGLQWMAETKRCLDFLVNQYPCECGVVSRLMDDDDCPPGMPSNMKNYSCMCCLARRLLVEINEATK